MNRTEYETGPYNKAAGNIRVRDYTESSSPSEFKQMRSMYRQAQMTQSNGGGGVLSKINFSNVARGLTFVSLGLGLAALLAPKQVQKMAGICPRNYSGVLRLVGLREVAHALMLMFQSKPNTGVWSRVAGDAMDLGLLGAAYTMPCVEKDKLTAATALIGGLTAVDVLTATQLSRQREDTRQYSALKQSDIDGRAEGGGFKVMQSVTINRSPEELYRFWRNFENLPKFMLHLQSVRVIDEQRSHWVAKAPAGLKVAWDARIIEDRPNELIAWRSTDKASVPNSGVVRFEPRPAGRGTVVRVEIEYRPPGGAAGRLVAKLWGEEPGQQVKGDLNRFKQVIETGEVVLSEGSPQGLGEKLMRPARPITDGGKEEKISRSERRAQRKQEELINSMRQF